jgi:hypothetical protein
VFDAQLQSLGGVQVADVVTDMSAPRYAICRHIPMRMTKDMWHFLM